MRTVPIIRASITIFLLLPTLLCENQIEHVPALRQKASVGSKQCSKSQCTNTKCPECSNDLTEIPMKENPFDLVNGAEIESKFWLQANSDIKLNLKFYYGLNSKDVESVWLNPRFYSKYIIIQSR